jgi:excisionase family DNA binding protein
VTPADLDLAAAIRSILRHPLVRAELRAIMAEAAPPSSAPSVLTVDDVAQLQGVEPDTIRDWIHRRGLRACRAPGTRAWRIRAEDLEAFLAGERRGPEPHNPAPVDLEARRAERARRIADSVRKGT